MFKKQKGITLIALVITIIVLLILAGVTIAAITSNESAPNKAVKARTENDRGAARDAATLLVAEKTQEYYEGKYVGNNNTARTSATVLDYLKSVLSESAAVTTGGYTVVVDSNAKITVTKGETLMATGTVDAGGTINWDAEPVESGSGSGGQGGGQQVSYAENSVHTLATDGAIKRWDTINYDPGALTTASIDLPEGASIEGTKVASVASDLPDGATLNDTISASSASNWVVLDVTEDGDVLIMPRTVSETTLTLTGMDGYNNAVEALDMVAGIYLNPAQAESARSLRVEDVNTVEGHTPNGEVNSGESWTHRYGMNLDKDDTTYKYLDITDEGEGNTASQTYNSTATTGYYNYQAPSFGGLPYCWLASRCVGLYSDSCDFTVRILYGGDVDGNGLFDVNSGGYASDFGNSYCVVPVVTLKSDIQLESSSTFYTQTATATTPVSGTTEFVHHAWTIKNSTN